MFTPPALSTSATYRCVTAAACDTVTLNDDPDPTCDTIAPVEASTIDIPYGVGPISLFAVAVSVTDPPTAGPTELAPSEIEYVPLETRYVNSSAGPATLVPPGPVTVTSTVPPTFCEFPAGATAEIDVAEFTVTPDAAVPPNATESPAANPDPVTVTAVPPEAGPEAGETPLTAGTPGGAAYVNRSAELVALAPPGPVTVTSTVPDPAGDVAVIDVADPTVTPDAAVPPNATESPAANPDPVTVTAVPPEAGPEAGETPLTAGAGGAVPPHVTTTGAEFAWMFTPPALSTSATYRCVTAAACDTVTLNDDPDPTCDTIAPVEASTIDIPYGVGPISLFAVAVSVTDPPTAGPTELAPSEIEYVPLETRYVNSSAGPATLVPPGPVTVTSTVPPTFCEFPAGATAEIDVAEFTVTPDAAVPPNATESPAANPDPVTVTAVPPEAGPEAGETPLTAGTPGGAAYVNRSAELVALAPPGPVTVTSTVPDPAGDVAVIDVADPTVTPDAAVPPNATESPAANPDPVTVTAVPPEAGPEAGETPLTAGAGGAVPPHVTTTGAEFAWMFTPPALSTSATYRCVTAAACDTVTLNDDPDPTCDTIAPVEASTIDIPYGVGPISLFAVAVSVTDPPTAGPTELAPSEIEYVPLETRYVNSSAGPATLVPPGPVTVTSTVPPTFCEFPAGATAEIDVAEFTVTPDAAVPPNATESPAANPDPVTVTAVPPDGLTPAALPAEKMTPTAVETSAGDSPQVGA